MSVADTNTNANRIRTDGREGFVCERCGGAAAAQRPVTVGRPVAEPFASSQNEGEKQLNKQQSSLLTKVKAAFVMPGRLLSFESPSFRLFVCVRPFDRAGKARPFPIHSFIPNATDFLPRLTRAHALHWQLWRTRAIRLVYLAAGVYSWTSACSAAAVS